MPDVTSTARQLQRRILRLSAMRAARAGIILRSYLQTFQPCHVWSA